MAINRDKPTTHSAKPTASLSPEALQALLDNVAELKATVAKYQAEAVAATKAMGNGKSEVSTKNDLACIKAFKKALGIVVTPRVDVLSYRLWVEQGYAPVKGSHSVRVGTLRLFHRTQVEKLTSAQIKEMKDQKSASEARKSKGNVTELRPAS